MQKKKSIYGSNTLCFYGTHISTRIQYKIIKLIQNRANSKWSNSGKNQPSNNVPYSWYTTILAKLISYEREDAEIHF